MAGKVRNRGIPWEEIRKAFVEGSINDQGNRFYPSMSEVSKQFNVPKGSIGARAAKEQWAEQREILANKIMEITNEKTIEAVSDAGSKFDLLCFNVASRASMLLSEKLEVATRNADVDEMSKLSTALKNFQQVGRLALGLSTDISKTSGSLNVNAKDLTRMDEDG